MRRSRLNYIGYILLTNILASLILTLITLNTGYDANHPYRIEKVTILIYAIATGIQIRLTYDRLRDMDKYLHYAWLVILPFAWLYFAFEKGTEGENQYGPSPAQLKAEEKAKEYEQQAILNPTDIDLIIHKIEINIYPSINKVESINFQLSELDERLFYKISPENVKKLRKRLEILANRLKDDDTSYGYKYAERCFSIGDKIIFRWKRDIKF